MQLAAARIVAVVLMGGVFAPVAEAAIIRGSGTFEVLLYGDEELGDVFDPPLFGSGSFEIRSRPYDPGDVFEVFDFEVLDFSYTLAGFTWDESDITRACCTFTPDGQPLTVDFEFDNGDARGLLIWAFDNGAFGMNLFAPNLESHGASDTDSADGSEIDFTLVVVPEPGSLALLGLGLLGLGLTRRRANWASHSTQQRARPRGEFLLLCERRRYSRHQAAQAGRRLPAWGNHPLPAVAHLPGGRPGDEPLSRAWRRTPPGLLRFSRIDQTGRLPNLLAVVAVGRP